MKTILLTIILLISIVTFSQDKLVGKYCSIPIGESNVTCIDFKENERFEYNVTDCLGLSAVGTGSFVLVGNQLKLIFGKKEQDVKNGIKIIEKTTTTSENETQFEFDIKDENGFEIPTSLLRLSDSTYFRIDEITKTITVFKNSSSEKFRISFVGYETLEFELDSKTDKKVEINLTPVQPLLITNRIMNLELTELNENEFYIGKNSLENKFRKSEK